jgi:cold-inducible RNA-binding protein
MGTKIYVGNMAFNATEEQVRELFAPFGEVESVKLITDQQTGRPRGFGFVEMTSAEAAKSAIEALNGKSIMDRNLAVSEAKPQQSKDRGFSNRGGGFGGQKRGGGFGGGGGGFGGGGRRPERGNR